VNSFGKNLALWVIIILLVFLLFNLFQNTAQRGNQQEMNYSDFLNDVARHQVSTVKIQGNSISGTRTSGGSFTTYTPTNDPDLVKTLRDNNVQIKVSPSEEGVPTLFSMLVVMAVVTTLATAPLLDLLAKGPVLREAEAG